MMKKQMWARTLMCVLAVGLMLFAHHSISVQADPFQATMPPPATPIDNASKIISAYNKIYTGQIDDNAPTETWTFPVKGNDVISIQVMRVSGTLVPQIVLADSSGKEIVNANHDNTFAQATIETVQVPAAGTYNIVVSRLDEANGKTAGQYQLIVFLLGTGPDHIDVNLTHIFDTSDGAGGNLDNLHWAKDFSFGGQHEYFRITVYREGGSLMPTLTVFDDKGNILKQAGPNSDGDVSVLDVLLPPTCCLYVVRVARKDNEKGTTQGQFRLKIALLGADTGDPSDTNVRLDGTLTLGQSQNVGISNQSPQEKFLLTVDNTHPLRLTVIRDTGTFIPVVKVFDMHQKELASADADTTFGTATILSFTPPSAGQYLVTVLRRDGEVGATEGGGNLLVQATTS
jgi:hypothetical protein